MQVFQSNCSLPSSTGISQYISSPNIRGTLDILWTCISLILLCTWSIIHLNVPIETKPTTSSEHFHHEAYLAARKLWWMFINVLAPEVIMGKAVMDLLSARSANGHLKSFASKDDVEWSLSHTFLANMGGFAVDFGNGNGRREAEIPTPQGLRPPIPLGEGVSGSTTAATTDDLEQNRPAVKSITAVASSTVLESNDKVGVAERDHASLRLREFYAVRMSRSRYRYGVNLWSSLAMGRPRWTSDDRFLPLIQELLSHVSWLHVGHQKYTSYYYNLMALRGHVWILDAHQLLYAREHGLIAKLPQISENEIEDKNKGDPIVKALAIVQALWLGIELIMRWVQGLPSSQLEVMTLAFAVCSFLTYLMLWSKPKDVMTRVHVPAVKVPTVEDIGTLGRLGPTTIWYLRAESWIPNNGIHYLNLDESRWMKRIAGGVPLRIGSIGSVIGAMVFGSVHLIAWNFDFPTKGEQLAWKIVCIVTIVTPIGIGLLMMYGVVLGRWVFGWTLWGVLKLIMWIMGALMVTYCFGRGFIIVEALRSIFYLPSGAYVATETWNVPHLG
ncbi:uncharacterized protein Z518_03458 [Rhinocladiella mackenziei CBS 650.93]|uniref:Uncharacterized protein n=1 Tax=Rhinocladiella mackenziei CBS 650.93 TaxID=1442369 RepID=A0A0D2IZE5_9EURO|nr:uncharacterized protein Z518_03458 [Rhinocladiella mackenziei CBS 650.93]KIX08801.1 hypothetical protein Z518_03458 [Rhinocladiella mackenziei CBS 650.93]